MTQPVEVRDLRRSFGSKVALAAVDLRVGPGEIVGFVGPNGAGKSTCLRALVGLIRPDGGSARVFGLDAVADSLTVRRHVSYLPGETSVYAHLRGDDFLAFALHFYPRHDVALLRALREQWPLPWQRRVRTYSAGMKQKLALMACLAPDVGLYLLDEPDRALDATARLYLREVLAGMRERGKSVLLSSHHLADVEALADRLVFVIEGRTVDEQRVEATRSELRQWLRLRLRGDGELPPGARAVERETDGSLRVRVDGDPLQFLQRIARERIETVELGVTRLEDLYRALAHTAEAGK